MCRGKTLITILVLVPALLLAAACGKTMVATGGLVTLFGVASLGIPDDGQDGGRCEDGSGCVDVDFEVQEGGVLLVGLALMGFGAVINAFENRAREPEAQARVPRPVVMVDTAPRPDRTGRWREVPPSPDE